MRYSIKNDVLKVAIDSFGAQIKSVQYNNQERAWQNENGAWKDTAPLLFPVCGHVAVTVDDKTYAMPAHGFVKKAEFALIEQTPTSITLACEANEHTKTLYPFAFAFLVTYTVQGATLKITYTVKNNGDKALYFACGGHDSFALDSNVDAYQIAFDKQETLMHYAHDDDGYLTGETACYGENTQTLALPKEYLAEGRTLIFKDVQSRKVTLQKTDGTPLAHITFEGFGNLLIWRATADSKYVCIEPWTNLPDAVNEPKKEFSQKDGVYKVDAKQEKVLIREITYV